MIFDTEVLLTRHNPILVIYPQDPVHCASPGNLVSFGTRYGDYHPCSADFFLARVYQRDRPKSYDLREWVATWLFWKPLHRTGLDRLRDKLGATSPEVSLGWELDLADLPSQRAGAAWKEYGRVLQESDHPYAPTVYGRVVQSSAGPVLQYWYLYYYNDFRNVHEGDWETIVIELAPDETPIRVGGSAHFGGFRLAWNDARKEGEHPIVYIARGSHANYFAYSPEGYDVLDLRHRVNPPTGFTWLVNLLIQLPPLRRWRDHPPADPVLDARAPFQDQGIRLQPTVKVLPDEVPTPGSEKWKGWWWRRYEGAWGSAHARIVGNIGPDSPWRMRQQPERWNDPGRWISDSLHDWSPSTLSPEPRKASVVIVRPRAAT